jgi:ASC-1-like (ASCH) protein
MIHELKIDPIYFEAVWNGTKNFEIRKNDRCFQVGDIIVLKEFNGDYTCRENIKGIITYITNYMQMPDYVVFGFNKLESRK